MQVNHSSDTTAFTLNGLRVVPASGQVLGEGGEVRLEPRVMALLQALASRPGELVSRSELLSALWPGAGVYDEALTQCVYQLRHQLGEAAGDADFRQLVKTVPKRGYILQAEVLPVASRAGDSAIPTHEARDAPAVVVDAAPSPARPKRSLAVAALLALLVLAAAWIAFRSVPVPESSPQPANLQAIAVLPFLPVVPDQGDPVLELGMADTLISRLSSMNQVVVRPVNSVRRFGNPDRDSLQAGKILDVDAVLEGTLQRSGDELRVTARLLRVTDGSALWAGSFDAPLAGVFAMQDQICESIAKALQLQLTPGRTGFAPGGTRNAQAYELYMRGRYHLVLLTAENLLAARDYFEQAITLDGRYAMAWLGLASANFRLPLAGEMPPGDHYSRAREAAQRALAIDDTLAEGHAFLGWVSFWSDRDWVQAERHFQQAIRLNPNEFESRLGYAHMLFNTGRFDESVVQMRRAREINPLFPMGAVLESGFLMSAGKQAEAVRMMELAVSQNEGFWLARLNMAELYYLTGRNEEALAEIAHARELAPDSNFVVTTEIRIQKANGKADVARALLDRMVEKSRKQYVSPYYMAMAFQGIGDEDRAMEYLQQAVAENNPMLVFLGVDGIWDPLRDRTEFAAIMRHINLEEYFN